MALESGTRLGPYEVLSALGAGGMGEVYKARDTRLDRLVAIKVLPDALASHPERHERFEREARTISSLNHPHICALYDVGRQELSAGLAIEYLVMELLEGETLAQRLTRGPLPLDQALRHAIDIADALTRAHRQGIVHRDLKPGNVMLTKQGAKLLDFGLARVGVTAPAVSSTSFMPTQQHPLTQQGTLLGTFQYMAPEQLEGQEADARSDIFAFGAVLYEMVTGCKAFEGKSQASLVASIMSGTPPPISTLQPMTPPSLDRVIRVCLAKDPDERWQTAQDLAAELKWIAEAGSQVGTPAPVAARRKWRERAAWIAAAMFAVGTIAVSARLFTLPRPAEREPVRFSILSPKGVLIEWPRLSPDGRTIAFVGIENGIRSIWVRPIGSFDAVRLPGTEGVGRHFWSPDSRYIGFVANRSQLKKVAASGGPPQLICDAPLGSDGSWSQAGVIFFDGRVTDPIKRVADSGGVPAIAVPPDTTHGEAGTAWPYFLPDGRHFLFMSTNGTGPVALKLGSLDDAKTTTLADIKSRFEYSSGHIFYVSEQVLMARPFSPAKLAFTGEPFPVTDRMQTSATTGLVDFSTSAAGDLAYITNAGTPQSQLLWVDRTGKEAGTMGSPTGWGDLALSPDGTRVAVQVSAFGGRNDIWVVDVKRGTSSRLTFDTLDHFYPLWSRDGTRIAYNVGARKIAVKLASGAGNEEVLAEDNDSGLFVNDWSSDGSTLLVNLVARDGNRDLVALQLAGKQRSPYLQSPEPIRESRGVFSPNGRWVAYRSNESGRGEIYVQSFPASGGKWQISTGGANVAVWTGDGKEILYQALDDAFYSVPVNTSGATLEVGTPVKLFQRRLQHDDNERNRWTISRDGQRFLLNVPLEDAAPRTIQVVLDWANSLQKK